MNLETLDSGRGPQHQQVAEKTIHYSHHSTSSGRSISYHSHLTIPRETSKPAENLSLVPPDSYPVSEPSTQSVQQNFGSPSGYPSLPPSFSHSLGKNPGLSFPHLCNGWMWICLLLWSLPTWCCPLRPSFFPNSKPYTQLFMHCLNSLSHKDTRNRPWGSLLGDDQGFISP